MRKLDRFLTDYLFILAILVAATIIMTWPLAGKLGMQIPGSEGDAWEHLWTFRWVKEALATQSDIFFTDRIFYPQGTSLAAHNFAWLHIALWLPLQTIFGEAAAYSLLILSTFVFNGFAVYLLAHTLTGQRLPSILSGSVAAFWPNILSHHDHPNLIVTAWVSLSLLAIYKLFKTKKQRYAILAGISLALLGITRWQSLVLGGLAIVLYFLFQTTQHRPNLGTKGIIRLAFLINGLGLALMLPLLYRQFGATSNLSGTIEAISNSGGQSDLLAYFLPNRFHPWWGHYVFDLFYGSLQTNKVFVAFVGYTTLVLAAIGLGLAWKRTRFWFGLAATYVLLALGAELLINGTALFPLPYRLLESTVLGALVRTPDRFNVFLSIPVALLTGFGAQALLKNSRINGRFAHLLVICCLLLILLEYAVYYPTLPLNNYSNWYNTLSLEEDDFAILEWPVSDKNYDETYMHYQSIHRKAMVGGSLARPTEETYAFLNSLALLQDRAESKAPPASVVHVGEQLNQLAQSNIRYLVFHKQFMNEEELSAWQDWLYINSVYEDAHILVYETTFEVGITTPFTAITDDGLGLIDVTVSPQEMAQGGSAEVDIYWGTVTPPAESFEICFELVSSLGESWQSDCAPLTAVSETNTWEANDMVIGRYSFAPSPYLAAGPHQVHASIVGETGRYTAPLGELNLDYQQRVFTETQPANLLANWNDEIGLQSFQLLPADATKLDLELTWFAQQRILHSYKLFVHLIDEEAQEIVAQVDTVPRNWAYPTSWWDENEQIAETITLPLAEPLVDTKRYSLWIGFYDPDSGERIPVEAQNPLFWADANRLWVAEIP